MPESSAVPDDERRRKGHGRTGDERIEESARSQRDSGNVVAEGPPQIAPDRPKGPAGQTDGGSHYAQVIPHNDEVGSIDGDVGARPHGEAEVG